MSDYISQETASMDECKHKIKTSFARIVVGGTLEKPCYNIWYSDPADGKCHIGFGSYRLDYVFRWLAEEFEVTEPCADVEPVRHWIPRSERMPEVDDYYLCEYHFDGYKKKRITTFFCYATDPNPHFQGENHYGLKVTHWMPLPELPEEEQ